MYNRTYGWVQNPSDFKKLKLVVQIFDNASMQYSSLKAKTVVELIPLEKLRDKLQNKLNNDLSEFTYSELVGSSKDINGNSVKHRKDAIADGLIQITVLPESAKTRMKNWTDNWTADGYLRWALSLNFVKHDRESDKCKITDLGLKFSRSEDSEIGLSKEELDILRTALLSYPPAMRVLQILNDANKPVNKFYIGNLLGFKGEKGFTSYPSDLMMDWFVNSSKEDMKTIRSDVEGTSDKYARMISTWLTKVGFVSKSSKDVNTICGIRKGFIEYSITAIGINALRRANGSSKNVKQEKYITWEFLSSDVENRDYVRTRRSYILKILKKTNSISMLQRHLEEYGFSESKKVILSDLSGLNSIGIRINFDKDSNKVRLLDDINDFSIPNLSVTEVLKSNDIENIKKSIICRTNLPEKYYELIDIAYDGKRNRDFEIVTMDLLINIYGFKGSLLGGGRRPDGIVFSDDFGLIIDTKAYGTGYGKSISQEDEMVRYIEDNKKRDLLRNSSAWWRSFPENISKDKYHFLWISSKFTGQFSSQILSAYQRTGVIGGALNVENLLIGADLIKSGKISLSQFCDKFNNDEIIW